MTLLRLKLLIILILLYTTNLSLNAQICDDWKSQSTAYVLTGNTPEDPGFYQWEEKANIMQGVHLCVLNADVIPVYIQQNNNYINFTSRFSPTAAMLFMLQLEVNINDGGWTTVYSGSSKQDIVWYGSSARFPLLGEYNLKVRIAFHDQTIRMREYHIKVIPASDKLYKDNAGNTLRKWSGNEANALNAIVFSEGFDAYNTNGQEMYYHAAGDLIECLNSNGYDVFLLDNSFGTQSIRNNAAIFASAVEYVSFLYGEELIVAGGVSMGGIISRYALAKAEENGNPLPVHTFIAIDSPHQGAVISEPLQNFKKDNEGNDEFAKHALSNIAARQLLMYNAYDPGGGTHTSFFSELNSLNGDGYPHLTRNIGVSFSTEAPNPNSGCWYKVTYHTGPISGTVKTFDLTSAERQAGSWLPKDLTSMSPIIKRASYWWIQLLIPVAVPLYYPTIEFERFTDPAYIPYYSAMDIRNGQSMFDVCIEPSATSWHDVLPNDILEDIVNEIILTDIYFQHKNVIGRWALRGKKIVSGYYVTPLVPKGNVRILPGGELEMIASENIMLRPGFEALTGSEANMIVDPDLYFGCPDKKSSILLPEITENNRQLINTKLLKGMTFSLYPNPAGDVVNLHIDTDAATVRLDILDIQSRLVLQKNLEAGNGIPLDISMLESGTYIVQINDGEEKLARKLLVR